VAPFVEDEPGADGRFGAALLFIRWTEGGDRPVGHLETDYIGFGATADEALTQVLALTLYEVKRHLDRCIERAAEQGTEKGEG